MTNDTRRGWGVSVTPRSLLTPGKDPVPIIQEVGWAPGPVWTGAENLAATEIRTPDRPARSQSLYRLRSPAHRVTIWCLAMYPQTWLRDVIHINIVRLERLKIDNDAVCPVVSCETSSPSVSIVGRASDMPAGCGISVMTSSFVSRWLDGWVTSTGSHCSL